MGDIRPVGEILAEMRTFAADTAFRTVWDTEGRVAHLFAERHFQENVDVVLFRLLLIYHFGRFVMSSPVLAQKITLGERWNAVLLELREGRVPAKISWNRIIPLYAVTDNARIRKMFQSTKRDQGLTFAENVVVQKIATVMRSYTLESPLGLLRALFPKVDLTVSGQRVLWQEDPRYPPDTLNLDAIVYYSLNTYVNWVALNVNSIVNTGAQLSPKDSERRKRTPQPYNVFCSVCFRTFTFRTKQRRDNPKHSDMIYCTDTHTTVSSCCNASLRYNSSLGTHDTVLLFCTGNNSYRIDDDRDEDDSLEEARRF